MHMAQGSSSRLRRLLCLLFGIGSGSHGGKRGRGISDPSPWSSEVRRPGWGLSQHADCHGCRRLHRYLPFSSFAICFRRMTGAWPSKKHLHLNSDSGRIQNKSKKPMRACRPGRIFVVQYGWNNSAVYYLGRGECFRHLPYIRIDSILWTWKTCQVKRKGKQHEKTWC